MNLECPHCSVEVKIDPARLPAGRAARVACPRCKEVFPLPIMTSGMPSVDSQPQREPPFGEGRSPAPLGPSAPPVGGGATGPLGPEATAWLRREMDALRERLKGELAIELLGARGAGSTSAVPVAASRRRSMGGPPTAIVAAAEPSRASAMAQPLGDIGLEARPVADLKSALKALDDDDLALVVIEKSFGADEGDSTKLLEWLNRMPGIRRRDIFVAWIADDVRTADGGVAFICGANIVVNTADVARLGGLLRDALTEHEKFYRLFHEVLETING